MSSVTITQGIVLSEPDDELRVLREPDAFFQRVISALATQYSLPLIPAGDIWTPERATPSGGQSGLLYTEEYPQLLRFIGDAEGQFIAAPVGGTFSVIGTIAPHGWAYLPQGMLCYMDIMAPDGSHLNYNGLPVQFVGSEATAA